MILRYIYIYICFLVGIRMVLRTFQFTIWVLGVDNDITCSYRQWPRFISIILCLQNGSTDCAVRSYC